jgi:type IV secretory pathway VirB10-like protein
MSESNVKDPVEVAASDVEVGREGPQVSAVRPDAASKRKTYAFVVFALGVVFLLAVFALVKARDWVHAKKSVEPPPMPVSRTEFKQEVPQSPQEGGPSAVQRQQPRELAYAGKPIALEELKSPDPLATSGRGRTEVKRPADVVAARPRMGEEDAALKAASEASDAVMRWADELAKREKQKEEKTSDLDPSPNRSVVYSGNSVINETPTEAAILKSRSLMLTIGDSFECVLDQRIVSDLPGLVRCHTTEPVFSSDGKVVLFEAGTKVSGQFQAANKIGQTRLPVTAARIETPKGVVVRALDSPMTDSLGGIGVTGDVNNHWVDRIGAAFLLALVDDGVEYLKAREQAKSAGGVTTLNSSTASVQSMSGKVLESTINKPPTITREHGTRVRIVLARDMDFTSVYKIR